MTGATDASLGSPPGSAHDRAHGALLGLAVGDAVGMPTEDLSRAEIAAEHGAVTGLVAPGPGQRIAAGLPAGSVTDDTQQALLLADLLLAGDGHVEPAVFAAALLGWEREMAARGSLGLLGPSTKRAVERVAAGVPAEEAGRYGVTNGAAMRVTPVGVAVPPEPLGRLVDAVVEASRVTHDTSLGLAAAAAVAAAVSSGVEGGTLADAITLAGAAADLAAERAAARGRWVAGGQVGPRIRWAVGHLRGVPRRAWAEELDTVVGTGVAAQESVVAAFAVLAVAETPWAAVLLAASAGGDTDTIAAIAGAVTGAHAGVAAWPADVAEQVRSVNALDLAPRVEGLLALRRKRT